MVGQCKVIVNGLRYAKEFLFLAGQDREIRKFLDSVHGIISTNIDKRINIKTVQYTKDLLIDGLIFVDLRKFKTTGT